MLGEGLYKVVECGSSLARRWVLVLVDSESSILPVRVHGEDTQCLELSLIIDSSMTMIQMFFYIRWELI